MRTILKAFLVVTGFVGLVPTSFAGDAAAGKQLATTTCAACHGANGISVAGMYPNLAGQKADYLVAQLKAFRDGGRKNAIMNPMAAHLTDADIENFAAYFSNLKAP